MVRILYRGQPAQLLMRIGKQLAVAAGFAALACRSSAVGFLANLDPTALLRGFTVRRALFLALDDKPTRDIKATICMKEGDGTFHKAEVLMNTEGFERLELKGANGTKKVILDNLDTRTIYDPARGKISVGKSPRSLNGEGKRIELIFKNYNVELKRVTLLQRTVLKISAAPKVPELSKVDIYVDPQSGFVLQTISTGPNGHEFNYYRTCSLTYPSHIPSYQFQLISAGPISTSQEPAPRFVQTYAEAKKILGYKPLAFKSGAEGFVVEKLFILGHAHPKGLGIQLTNGLAHATVFEFAESKAPKWVRSGSGKDAPIFRKGIYLKIFCRESAPIIIGLQRGF